MGSPELLAKVKNLRKDAIINGDILARIPFSLVEYL